MECLLSFLAGCTHSDTSSFLYADLDLADEVVRAPWMNIVCMWYVWCLWGVFCKCGRVVAAAGPEASVIRQPPRRANRIQILRRVSTFTPQYRPGYSARSRLYVNKLHMFNTFAPYMWDKIWKILTLHSAYRSGNSFIASLSLHEALQTAICAFTCTRRTLNNIFPGTTAAETSTLFFIVLRHVL
jgi:hypothetical protein